MSALDELKNKKTPPTELELCILMSGSLEDPEKAAEQLEYLIGQNQLFLENMNVLRDKLDRLEAVAEDVNEWLKTSANLKGTAHQRELEAALKGE